jgi:hypothetical protein
MQQLRRGADAAPEMPAPTGDAGYSFEDSTLYDSHRGFLRFMRRLLNPILKLFFNPNPIVHALHTQAALNRDAAAREAERQKLQGEWNALHYEILQRLVTEVSRVSVEMQALSLRVEALGARVDFNDRKVRSMDTAPQSGRSQSRPPAEPPQPVAPPPSASPEPSATVADAAVAADGSATSEGTRRRRRRRRGRRGSGSATEAGAALVVAGEGLAGPDSVGTDLDEGDDDEPEGLTSPEPMTAADSAPEPAAPLPVAEEPREQAIAAPPIEQPTPPPDEPAPQAPEPPDPGPPDR